jgi:DNA/RNA endonuclease YhcR with UshA esterase domain
MTEQDAAHDATIAVVLARAGEEAQRLPPVEQAIERDGVVEFWRGDQLVAIMNPSDWRLLKAQEA